MGVVQDMRTGKATPTGKPSKPHVPSAKEAQSSAPRGKGKPGVSG